MITLLVYLVIAVVVCTFAYWVINNYIPEPMRKFGTLVLALIVVIFVVWLLLGMVGGGNVSLPHIR
jgi:hypothetical protein